MAWVLSSSIFYTVRPFSMLSFPDVADFLLGPLMVMLILFIPPQRRNKCAARRQFHFLISASFLAQALCGRGYQSPPSARRWSPGLWSGTDEQVEDTWSSSLCHSWDSLLFCKELSISDIASVFLRLVFGGLLPRSKSLSTIRTGTAPRFGVSYIFFYDNPRNVRELVDEVLQTNTMRILYLSRKTKHVVFSKPNPTDTNVFVGAKPRAKELCLSIICYEVRWVPLNSVRVRFVSAQITMIPQLMILTWTLAPAQG